MMDIPMTDQIYRHFRGGMYRIITCAVHAVSGEDMVVYQALYGDLRVYVQELSLFMGSVDREKYPDADQDTCFRSGACAGFGRRGGRQPEHGGRDRAARAGAGSVRGPD